MKIDIVTKKNRWKPMKINENRWKTYKYLLKRPAVGPPIGGSPLKALQGGDKKQSKPREPWGSQDSSGFPRVPSGSSGFPEFPLGYPGIPRVP